MDARITNIINLVSYSIQGYVILFDEAEAKQEFIGLPRSEIKQPRLSSVEFNTTRETHTCTGLVPATRPPCALEAAAPWGPAGAALPRRSWAPTVVPPCWPLTRSRRACPLDTREM
jgi:hypothetical protein